MARRTTKKRKKTKKTKAVEAYTPPPSSPPGGGLAHRSRFAWRGKRKEGRASHLQDFALLLLISGLVGTSGYFIYKDATLSKLVAQLATVPGFIGTAVPGSTTAPPGSGGGDGDGDEDGSKPDTIKVVIIGAVVVMLFFAAIGAMMFLEERRKTQTSEGDAAAAGLDPDAPEVAAGPRMKMGRMRDFLKSMTPSLMLFILSFVIAAVGWPQWSAVLFAGVLVTLVVGITWRGSTQTAGSVSVFIIGLPPTLLVFAGVVAGLYGSNGLQAALFSFAAAWFLMVLATRGGEKSFYDRTAGNVRVDAVKHMRGLVNDWLLHEAENMPDNYAGNKAAAKMRELVDDREAEMAAEEKERPPRRWGIFPPSRRVEEAYDEEQKANEEARIKAAELAAAAVAQVNAEEGGDFIEKAEVALAAVGKNVIDGVGGAMGRLAGLFTGGETETNAPDAPKDALNPVVDNPQP